ncbi:MAG: hypothetical protein KDC92_17155, partial [Bacteroidetes bacterium]|nr:hypothetical protein [Bacteroidota bacterium]
YVQIVELYLKGKPFSFSGEYYQLENTVLRRIESDHKLISFFSGRSESVSELAIEHKGIHLDMLPNPNELPDDLAGKSFAFGIVTAETHEMAVETAKLLFPPNKIGEKTLKLAAHNTDSTWKKELVSAFSKHIETNGYWTQPLSNFSEVPFMVLGKSRMIAFLDSLLKKGVKQLVINLPDSAHYKLLSDCFD